MVEVKRSKYPLNPTLKLVTPEGRATAEFFRVLKAIGDLISNITIEDGEVTADMISVVSLEAISATLGNVVIDGDLVVNGTITTGKVALNAISEISVGLQVGSAAPDGSTIVSVAVPVSSVSNTGVILTFTASQSVPVTGGSNFGSWSFSLYRNGVLMSSSPLMFYDDNFAVFVALQFVDMTPGIDPVYELTASVGSGTGNFEIVGGVLNGALFKR